MGFANKTPETGCRREIIDRRVSTEAAIFPLIDSNKVLSTHDRRRIPDRRVNGIEVSFHPGKILTD